MLLSHLLRAALPFLFILIAPGARSAVLPMGDEYFAFKLYIPGCLTTGSYDVASQTWTQSRPTVCAPTNVTTMPGPGGTPVTIESFETRLVGQVDNQGHALGGLFTLSGAIPSLGITQPSLLLSGSLLEAFYGPTLRVAGGGIQPNALIEVDFALPVFGNAGDILLWQPFALIEGWSYPPDLFPNQAPWQSSVTESDYRNYSNSQYLIYDRSVFFVAEPGTLVLLGLGIAGLVAGWRRPLPPVPAIV